MEEAETWSVLRREAMKFIFYACFLGGICVLMMQGFRWPYANAVSFYGENGVVEWTQVLFLLVSCLLLRCAGEKNKTQQPLMRILILLLICAVVREMDDLLDTYLGRHWWKIVVLFLICAAGGLAFRHRQELGALILSMIRHPSFGLIVAGLFTVFIFSRILGCGIYWRELLGSRDDARITKEIVEECTELVGYFFIMIGTAEYLGGTKGCNGGLASSEHAKKRSMACVSE
jgi:hypothetical protein